MKFVHTADWHIGKSVCDFSMLPDQAHFLKQLTAFLEAEKADALIIAGDLYDRPIPSGEAVSLLDGFFCDVVLRLKIPVLVIAGNHDSAERLSFGGALLSRAGLHILGEPSPNPTPVTLTDEHGEIDCWLLPYADIPTVNSLFPEEEQGKAKNAQQAFDKVAAPILMKADVSRRNLLICHGFFCCTKEAQTLAADETQGGIDLVNLHAFADFDYVAAGHVHRAQNIGSAMRYSGALMKYAQRESSHQPALTVVELNEKGSVSLDTVTLPPLRDMITVSGYFDDFMNTEAPISDYVFVDLLDQELILNAAPRLRERAFPNLMGLSYPERTSSEEVRLSKKEVRERDLPTLFQSFYSYLTDSDLSPEQKAAIKEVQESCQTGGDVS